MQPLNTAGAEMSLKTLVASMFTEINRLQNEVAKLSSSKSSITLGDLTLTADDDGNFVISNGNNFCTFNFEDKTTKWNEE